MIYLVRPGLPGPLARVLRDKVTAVAYLAFVALIIIATSGSLGADGVVTSTLSKNWRGAYDILVTAPSGKAVGELDTAGFVDPNFASVSSLAHIPLSSLREIRALSGVEIAAPIGFLGRVTPTFLYPVIGIPIPPASGEPVGYRVSIAIDENTGVGITNVQSYADNWILAPGIAQANMTQKFIAQTGSAQLVLDDHVYVILKPIPRVSSAVVAVDPIAESKLLGEAGDFLKPLAEYDNLASDAGALNCQNITTLPEKDKRGFDALVRSSGGPNTATNCVYGVDSSFAPYVRNTAAYPPLTLTAEISKIDEKPADLTTEGLALLDKMAQTSVGTVNIDLAARLRPFSSSDLSLAWPGEASAVVPTLASSSLSSSVRGLEFSEGSLSLSPSGALSARLVPQGAQLANGEVPQTSEDLSQPGVSQTYRSSQPQSAGPQIGGFTKTAAAPLELGTYDPSEIRDKSTVNDTPLGAYDPAAVSVGKPSAAASSPVLQPTLAGLGVASSSASAITTLAGAKTMGFADPVDAIRVRVADVTDFSSDSQKRIAKVAERISALGLTARIVAGSSAQPVALYVPDYFLGDSAPGSSNDLGWVTQGFTKLGAATSIQHNLAAVGSALFATSVGAAVALMILVQGLALRARRSASVIMWNVGIRRGHRLRWILFEEMLPLVLLSVPIILLALSKGWNTSLVTLSSALGVTMLTSLVSAVIGSHGPLARSIQKRTSSNRKPCLSKTRYSLLQLRGHPWLSAGRIAVIAFVLFMGSALAGLIPDLVAQASLTRLGTFVVQSSAAINTANAVSSLLAAVVMLVVISRNDAARRRGEWDVLMSSAGWTHSDVRQTLQIETFVLLGLALLLCGTTLILLHVFIGLTNAGLQFSVFGALAISIYTILTFSERRILTAKGLPT